MENEEMLEQTSDTENVVTQTTEENEEGIELTDTTETDNDTKPEEEKQEVRKSLRELLRENPEYQEEYNIMLKKRLEREDKSRQKELSKYQDTDKILRTTLNIKDGEDVNTSLRKFYESEGYKLPEPIKEGLSQKEIERLGLGDADDIIDEGYDAVEYEANRLARIGYKNLTDREKITFNKLAETLTEKKNTDELLALGAKKELLIDKKFIEFKNQFNSNVPMKTIYSLYMANQPKPEVDSPGSMRNSNSRKTKDFITEEEYEKMSREEVRANMALIEKSMSKW